MVWGLAGCGSGEDSSSSQPSTAASKPVTADPAVAQRDRPKVEVPDGPPPKQLEVEDLTEGTGVAAKDGDLVEINFIGVTYKGGKEFENSWDRKDPLFFRIGAEEVIRGWEQGLEGMKVGGRRELTIPPQLSFKGVRPEGVDPDETVVYVIDLIKAEAAPDAPESRLGGGSGKS
jgi:peptidylprolyl isomerase